MLLTLGIVFLFILIGGAFRSVEAGCQNTLMNSLKNMWVCALISYAVALTGFLVFLLFAPKNPWPSWEDIRHLPWWAPFGGFVGGAAVIGMIAVARYIGVATFSALVIVGEMVLALFLDNFGWMGFAQHAITWQRILAAVLITVAIWLMSDDSRSGAAVT